MKEWLPYPLHWGFALRAAFGYLEELVWSFDTISDEIDQSGHFYAEVWTPDELVEVIDGFLSEGEKIPQGNITTLKEMKKFLQEKLILIYNEGKAKGQERWLKASPKEKEELEHLKPEGLRQEAKKAAESYDYSPSQNGWFVEAYCRQWRAEWFEYLKDLVSRQA